MNSKLKFFEQIVLVYIISTFFSCNIYKQIPENQSVLRHNKINIVGVEKDLINDFFNFDELEAIPVQKPNSYLLKVFPLSMHIWAHYNQKDLTQFSQYMKSKIGSAPVLFDSTLLEKSKTRFQNYYFNIGHFENKVSYSYETKNKKTTVYYTIEPNTPYTISNISFDSLSKFKDFILPSMKNSYLQRGDIFNMNNLILERNRIAEVMNENGFYFFNKEFVFYSLDTNFNEKTLSILIKILPHTDTSDFQQYRMDSIYIAISKREVDYKKVRTASVDNVVFFQDSGEIIYNERFLRNMFTFSKDSLYSKTRSLTSLQRLTDLNNFKLINPNFSISDEKNHRLNALYSIIPFPKQYFSVGVSGYNSSLGLIGTNINFSYNNKNLTKRADRLNLSISTGIEFNVTLDPKLNNNSAINRSDISLMGNYVIDKLMVPFKVNKDKLYLFRSNFTGRYSYEKRFNFYDLHNLGTSFGYDWSKNKNIRHTYNPIAINYIFLPENSISEEFYKILDRNPFLNASFSNVFILGSNYQFFQNIPFRNPKFSFQNKINIETAGNFPFLANKIFKFDTDIIELANVEISQYLKLQAEQVYSFKFNKPTSIHSRLKIGYALNFGNSNFVPYVKQFFVGGPYSLRGFPIRSVGPGTLNLSFADIKDQTGEIVIENNYEYRFNIISVFKGALFTDIGNVWLANEFKGLENAQFKFSDFYKQFYISGGVGLRIDVNFLAIRMDLGFPIRVPYIAENNGWVISDAKPLNPEWRRNNLVFNFAIGYPF